MASEDRSAARVLDIGPELRRDLYRLDFFQVVRRLECINADKPRIGRSFRPGDDPIRLTQDPSLAFAQSALASFEPGKGGRPPRLAGYFFGLFGPNGPLPIHLTEYAYDRVRNAHDPTLVRFLDVFHHRMLSLFYRAWANNRPTVSFDRPRSDWFGVYLASLFGLGMESLRDRDALVDDAKLFFAGRLACQTRNPEGLQAMIRHFFGLPAAIDEFVGEWIELPQESRWRLGMSRETGALGATIILGARVWGPQHKFRVVLGPVGLDDFQRFLPGSDSLKRLVAMVRTYVGDELRWELNVVLKRDEAPPIKLGEQGLLGWTTWLGSEQRSRDADELMLDAVARAA